MLDLVTVHDSGEPVTTSLAIAEGVNANHKSVIQLVRQNLEDIQEFGQTAFEMRNSNSSAGRPTEYAILNEQQAMLLLTYMRNSEAVKKFKKALIKAFFEMKQQLTKQPTNMSRMEILQLAMKAEEEKLLLEEKIKIDAPKVEFAEKVEVSHGSISIAEAAKILGTGRNRLLQFLRMRGWVTRRNEPYQSRIESGLMDVKLSNWEHPDNGIQQSVTALVTGKGLSKLEEEMKQFNAN